MDSARRLGSLLFITCTFANGFQQGTDSAESEKEKDVYAIYSLILTNPRTSHGPDNNQRYLIAATTVPGIPKDPCVRPPKEREVDFREVLVDFENRKSTPRELKPALSLSNPYVLLSANEAAEFMKERSLGRTAQTVPNPRFQGVTDVFSLSDVYFNQRRTLALTFISTWCGGLCGLLQWRVFEKLDTGTWKERPWTNCTTMAGNFDSGWFVPSRIEAWGSNDSQPAR